MDRSTAYFVFYGCALLAGSVFSFALKDTRTRRVVRMLTIVLMLPLGLGIFGVALLFGFMWVSAPPTLGSLQSHFVARESDLNTLVHMSAEDAHYSRIAPTFVDRDETSGQPGRYMEDDPKAGLPVSRWDEYRKLYKRNGIGLGVQRDGGNDIFVMVGSEGLLNRGHATGYLFCEQQHVSADEYRFEPCVLNRNAGSHHFDPNTRKEAYSFLRIEGAWFAYDEGPS